MLAHSAMSTKIDDESFFNPTRAAFARDKISFELFVSLTTTLESSCITEYSEKPKAATDIYN